MKKVLILGVGNAQVDALEYLRSVGDVEVHGLSYQHEGSGIPLCDRFEIINITDISAVTQYARENQIDCIYSVGSDIAMPTVAAVSHALELPCFISYETAEICNNKHQLRQTLGADFEGNVAFMVVSSLSELASWNKFPCMLKPADSQGQRGVYKINSADEFAQYFDKSMQFSRKGLLITEEFVGGDELSVNMYLYKDEVRFCLVSDRIAFAEYPGGIIKEHHLPTRFADAVAIEKIKDMTSRVVKKLDIHDGPVYFQIKLFDGSPRLIEVTPRLDGCHMWRLISHYCGDNLLNATFGHLLCGAEPNFSQKFTDNSWKLKFLSEQPENAFDRGKYQVDGAKYLRWYYRTGDTVKPMNGYIEKCGYMIVEG